MGLRTNNAFWKYIQKRFLRALLVLGDYLNSATAWKSLYVLAMLMLCLQSHRLCCAVQKIWFQYFQNNSKYWHQHPICGSVPIASAVLYIKHHLRLQAEITDRWEIQKREFEKRETYFLTSCISTPFLAHDIRASESSGEKRIDAVKK